MLLKIKRIRKSMLGSEKSEFNMLLKIWRLRKSMLWKYYMGFNMLFLNKFLAGLCKVL